MTYRKPKIVAKSAPRKPFVAGCPVKAALGYCSELNNMCRVGALK